MCGGPVTTPATQTQQSPLTPYNAALAAAYAAAIARVRRGVFEFISRQWNHSGAWRDADAQAFVTAVTPVVEAAQRTVSTLTSSYLNTIASEMAGSHHPPVTVSPSEVTGSAVRAGVDPAVVYRRPYHQVWTDLAAGTPLDKAVTKAEERAVKTAATDLQLAKTHTAQRQFAGDERVVGYRRVPQGTYTCALCLIVSTRRYHKKKLMPVHPACDCGIEPLFGTFDPGPVLDEEFLNAVHDAILRDLGQKYVGRGGRAKDTRARELDYRDIVIVHNHGEIGPVLGVRGQKFTGPEDIRRFTHDKIEP